MAYSSAFKLKTWAHTCYIFVLWDMLQNPAKYWSLSYNFEIPIAPKGTQSMIKFFKSGIESVSGTSHDHHKHEEENSSDGDDHGHGDGIPGPEVEISVSSKPKQ